jgi:hypothetical protein
MSLRSAVGSSVRAVGLGRPLDASIRAVRRLRQAPTQAARVPRYIRALRGRVEWRIAYRRQLADPIRFRSFGSEPSRQSLAVVMCLWNRPERIQTILTQLENQETSQPLRLVLWNNNRADDARYESALEQAELSGALDSVEFYASPANLGGIGRFLAVRQLVRNGYSGPFVTLDDDQDIQPTFITDLLAAYQPHGAAGWWAFRTRASYWDRDLVLPGEDATYVGTGGAIYDSELVHDDAFFAELPSKYGFLEDLWASHVVRSKGWRLIRADTEIEFVLAERDQGHVLTTLKDDFYRYLATRETRWPNRP